MKLISPDHIVIPCLSLRERHREPGDSGTCILGRIEKEEREAMEVMAAERSEEGRKGFESGVAAAENSRRSTRITYVIVRQ